MPKTREQIAHELGISVTTLWRKIKKSNLSVPTGLVFPEVEAKILTLFQMPSLNSSSNQDIEDSMKRNEKK